MKKSYSWTKKVEVDPQAAVSALLATAVGEIVPFKINQALGPQYFKSTIEPRLTTLKGFEKAVSSLTRE